MQKISLHCLAGPLKDQVFPLRNGPVFIFGRYAKSSFSLAADPAASNLHFLIDTSEGRVRIIDLGSTNGLVINEKHMGGKQGTPFRDFAHLKSGDTILAGACLFRLSVVEESTARQAGPDARSSPGRDRADDGHGHLTAIMQKEISARLAAREREMNPPLQENGLPVIEGYTLLEKIADGGGSVVFKAVKDDSGATAAIKTPNAGGGESRRSAETLLREIAVVRQLRHGNIIRHLGDGVAGGKPYLALEYVDGGTMDELIALSPGQRLGAGQAVPLFLQLLEALASMHSRFLVHRDVNPWNILLDLRRGGGLAVKLSGFGLACRATSAGLRDAGDFPAEPHGHGAFACMPPEILTDPAGVIPESDVFGAAATFYRMVTGEHLYDFINHDRDAVIISGRIRPIIDLHPSLPGHVAAVISRALEHDPANRYANAQEMLNAFQNALA